MVQERAAVVAAPLAIFTRRSLAASVMTRGSLARDDPARSECRRACGFVLLSSIAFQGSQYTFSSSLGSKLADLACGAELRWVALREAPVTTSFRASPLLCFPAISKIVSTTSSCLCR
jgi:hypothetical protein